MWDIRRNVRPGGLADQAVTMQFTITSAPHGKSAYWLVVDDDVDLCLIDPGHPVDLWIRADLRALTEVCMGDRTLPSALRDGSVHISGTNTLTRRFPRWLGQHPTLAKIPPARQSAEPSGDLPSPPPMSPAA